MRLFKRNKPSKEQNGGVNISYSPYSDALLFGKYTQNGYLGLSAVFAAVDIISNSVALLPVNVKQMEENERTILYNHPVARLFDSMTMNRYNVIKTLVWEMILFGNSYLYIHRDEQGNPVKLTYLQHSDVTINYDKYKDEITYGIANHKNIPAKAQAENVMHFFKNTNDGINGVGILNYAARTLRLGDYLNSAADDFFGSGCGINGILKFTGRVMDDQKQKIRQQWSTIHNAGTQGGGLAVLEGDCDFIPVSHDANDAQLLESRTYQVSEIARYFNISPVLLQDLSNGNTYGTIEAMNINFVEYTLMPYIVLMQEEMNRRLFPTGSKYYIDLDENVLLRSDKQSQANYLHTLVSDGILNRNEARDMLDLNPVEGGDDFIIPYTDIAQNTIGDDSNEEINTQNTENERINEE